jgi:hypothetical protein
MAGNTASIIVMMQPPKLKRMTHRDAGIGLTLLALLLLSLAIPQVASAWLTRPENLDHTKKTLLSWERQQKFEDAMRIIPQTRTANALAYAALNQPAASTLKRTNTLKATLTAVNLSPGDPFNWYYLAAALEPEIFEPSRMVLLDQALTMSMMTGPLTRDLILARALMVVKYWDKLSQPLRDDFKDQIFNLWASSPADLRGVYLTMPPSGQKLVFDTLEQVPGESLKFNRFLDNPAIQPE